jgi:RNA polymerase sigma-70 factor (sigma-E family)
LTVAARSALGISMPKSTSKLADLYWKHAPDAVRFAYLVTGDRHLAEDIAQDAFIRAFGRWRDLRNQDSFGPYLRRTIVNLARDHFRKLQRECGHLRDHTELGRQDESPTTRIELHDELMRALRRLSVRQRAAVVLRYCEGLSEHEVADVLGTSVGAVNSLVARGLANLREQRGGVRR